MFVSYNPRSYYERLPELRQCIDMIASGYFSPEDPNLFRNIVSTLLDSDRFVSQSINQSIFRQGRSQKFFFFGGGAIKVFWGYKTVE